MSDPEPLSRLENRVEELANRVETRLDDHDKRMADLADQISRLSDVLRTLVSQLAGVPEHIASVCAIADAVQTIFRPIGWALGRGRVIVVAVGTLAGAVYAVNLLMEQVGVTWGDLLARAVG